LTSARVSSGVSPDAQRVEVRDVSEVAGILECLGFTKDVYGERDSCMFGLLSLRV